MDKVVKQNIVMRLVGSTFLSAILLGCASVGDPDGEQQRVPVRESSVFSTESGEPQLVRVEEYESPQNVDVNSEIPEPSQAHEYAASAAAVIDDVDSELGGISKPGTYDQIEDQNVSSAIQDNQDSATTKQEMETPLEAPAVVSSEAEETDLEDTAAESSGVDGLVQVPLIDPIVDVVEEVDESEVVGYLLDEAEQSFGDGNLSKAKGQAERAISLEPTAGRGYLILAEIALQEKRPEVAAEAVREGLASVSESDEVFQDLNEVLGQIAEMRKTAAQN